MNYVPVPSASLRAKPPLPSASMQPEEPDAPPAYEEDLIEDMATPPRPMNFGAQAASTPTAPNEWKPQPLPNVLPTGPMQPIAPPVSAMPAPPPSHRHFTPPPSQQSIGPLSAPHSIPQQPHATSSARVRRVTPMDAPPYSPPYPSSGSGPASQQQITGPQLPIPIHPNTGSFPTVGGSAAPVSRPDAGIDDGMPLGYVVASAFFLAIALVGFGLYLAFEVISL